MEVCKVCSKILSNIPNDMLEVSLKYCREKLGRADIVDLLKKNDSEAIGYFRYRLAEKVGVYLGEASELVKEVFLIMDTQDEELTITLPLTLIVRVEKYTAALASVVEALEATILEEYRKILSPTCDHLLVYVNSCFVEEEDFLRRRGLAVAVGSLHNPATRVWSRE
jgi:hypothetical protein